MPIVRLALTVFGAIFLLLGLLWIGQGLGVVRWPTSSFMIDQRVWSFRGIVLAVAGLTMLVLSRRRRPR